jgi:hypothetical protein
VACRNSLQQRSQRLRLQNKYPFEKHRKQAICLQLKRQKQAGTKLFM